MTVELALLIGFGAAWLCVFIACAVVAGMTCLADALSHHRDDGPVVADGHCLYVTPDPRIPGDDPAKRRHRALLARRKEREI